MDGLLGAKTLALIFDYLKGNTIVPSKLMITPQTEITVSRVDQVLSISRSVNPLNF